MHPNLNAQMYKEKISLKEIGKFQAVFCPGCVLRRKVKFRKSSHVCFVFLTYSPSDWSVKTRFWWFSVIGHDQNLAKTFDSYLIQTRISNETKGFFLMVMSSSAADLLFTLPAKK